MYLESSEVVMVIVLSLFILFIILVLRAVSIESRKLIEDLENMLREKQRMNDQLRKK